MNTFFGIFHKHSPSGSSDAHRVCLENLRRKFPRQFSDAVFISTDFFQLFGDFESSQRLAGKTLYCCGELYNQDELAALLSKKTSDFENTATLLLHLFLEKGLDSVSLLNGRFLIVLFDESARKIRLFNDQMGIQQTVYHETRDFILFGAEVKFLHAHPLCPRNIDWEKALKRPVPFVVIDDDQDYHTWFQDIFLLPEASCLSIDCAVGESHLESYWRPLGATNYQFQTAEQVMETYFELLQDAVRIRVQDADHASSFLSGGLDSSIICALAAQNKPLDTYSIITHVTMLDGATEISAALSKDLGFSNRQFLCPYNDLSFNTELWKKRVWRAESPTAHADSFLKTMLHDTIGRQNPECAYVLTGTGSDQLNGGLARWLTADQNDPEENWNSMSARLREEELRARVPEKHHALWGARRYLSHDFIHQISERPLERDSWQFYLKCNLHLNLFTLLWDENKAAAQHQRSVRFPFLDYRFLPLLSSVPAHLHRDLFYDKQILRKPSARFLPEYLANKGKMPAFTGKHDRRSAIYEYLATNDDYQLIKEALGDWNEPHPAIDKKALLKEVNRLQQQPNPVDWQYVFNVINLGLLEKLSEQDESSLQYESALFDQIEPVQHLDAAALAHCRKRLQLASEAELLKETVYFLPDCMLLFNPLRDSYYLAKDEMLLYEIDQESAAWLQFLKAVDQQKSAETILHEQGIQFADIQEYFYLCLRENILSTKKV